MDITLNVCLKCGCDDVLDHPFEWNEGLCHRCHTWHKYNLLKDSKVKDQNLEERNANWLKICPSKYMENSTNMIKKESYEIVRKWRLNPKGLLCLGESQSGKTTSCWRLLGDLYIQYGVEFQAMTEPEFSQLAAKYSRSRTIDEWLNRLCFTKLLFLDDIGHSATTSKHLEELYFVIENRTSWKRPIIATTQFTTSELTERAGRSGGDKTVTAILNRLKASCHSVIF